MNSIIYLGQVTACTAVFYLFYHLFLRKLTFFSINRWYLLSTVILSFLIPLIKLDINQPKPYTAVVEQVVYTYAPQQAEPPIFMPTANLVVEKHRLTWGEALRSIYIIAVAALTIHLLVTLFTFFKKVKGKRITKLGNINILSGNNKISNGSFLNYIFVNEGELSADEIKQIIAHEMTHVRLYHSVDRIIVKLTQIVLWFNPFIYLYARSVEENHEFEVDRVVANGTDKQIYANLLLHLSVAGNGMLYHNFSKVPLKKRITMLFIKPTTNMKKVIYLLFVPVVLISVLAFASLKRKEQLTKTELAAKVLKMQNDLQVKILNEKQALETKVADERKVLADRNNEMQAIIAEKNSAVQAVLIDTNKFKHKPKGNTIYKKQKNFEEINSVKPIPDSTTIIVMKSDSVVKKDAKHTELIGTATVWVNDIKLDAGRIKIDKEKKMIFASGLRKGVNGILKGRPVVVMGKGDTQMISDSILINYQTKSAHVWNSNDPAIK